MSTLRNPDVDDSQAELRAEFKRTMKARRRARQKYLDQGLTWLEAEQQLPAIEWHRFAHLRCGARTKSGGTPCKLNGLYDNGRCRLHGGLSTGPRTAEGKARSASNGLRMGTNGSSDATSLAADAWDTRKAEALREVYGLLLKGGWACVPKAYERYQDGNTATVKEDGKGGAVVTVIGADGKPAGEHKFGSLLEFGERIFEGFDPDLW